MNHPRRLRILALGLMLAASLPLAAAQAQSRAIPSVIDDGEFWRMVTELSEPGGTFPQQYMSNEDSAQFVIPALKETSKPGGVYIGVGLEQNFTYIAALQPKFAFIVDIRRDNMMEHLMYKALFELSSDRAEFLSRLLSRKRPPGLDANSTANALFDAFQKVEADSRSYDDNLRAVVDRLATARKFPLSETDKSDLGRILNAFRTAGPFTLRGQGDNSNPTYAQLMTATDLTGRNQSYLASEQNFKVVQKLEQQNLIVPLVGDFAGAKTLAAIGQYLKDRNAIANFFYVSNVERYLFDQGDDTKKFYRNVAVLPRDASSVFIRSITSDISRRLGIPILDNPAKWRSYVAPINANLKSFTDGQILAYRDLF
jgi:uncharacterized protein (DUF2461 family)